VRAYSETGSGAVLCAISKIVYNCPIGLGSEKLEPDMYLTATPHKLKSVLNQF